MESQALSAKVESVFTQICALLPKAKRVTRARVRINERMDFIFRLKWNCKDVTIGSLCLDCNTITVDRVLVENYLRIRTINSSNNSPSDTETLPRPFVFKSYSRSREMACAD